VLAETPGREPDGRRTLILVDTALAERAREGAPVRVGIVGAGFMGSRIARQIGRHVQGMEVVAVASRLRDDAVSALLAAGYENIELPSSRDGVDAALARGRCVASSRPLDVASAAGLDVVVEATGDVECGAAVATAAIRAGNHTVLVNADTDATVGPILKALATRAGVVVTGTDGDEPAVAMNLVRYARMAGLDPVLAGNMKGFVDPYRNPDTQRAFAESVGQAPRMITSFADGTKLSIESTLLANATGLGVRRRGMEGFRIGHVDELISVIDSGNARDRGAIDYTLGAKPGTGAFVVAAGSVEDAATMRYFKMGDGPLYLFYQPFHLPQLDVAITIARAALFRDAAVSPAGAPVCEVVTVAKRDLPAGTVLDGIGGFDCYGAIDNASTVLSQSLLPIGLAQGSTLLRDVARDEAIGRAGVDTPSGRLVDTLYAEQLRHFST
jgi:predicted homoserine dehydrogenase-like protein